MSYRVKLSTKSVCAHLARESPTTVMSFLLADMEFDRGQNAIDFYKWYLIQYKAEIPNGLKSLTEILIWERNCRHMKDMLLTAGIVLTPLP